jgi:hypothetical protein
LWLIFIGNTGLRNIFKPPPLKTQQNLNQNDENNNDNEKNEVINNNGLSVGSLVAIVICSVIGAVVVLSIGGFLVKYFIGQSASSLIEPEVDAYYQMVWLAVWYRKKVKVVVLILNFWYTFCKLQSSFFQKLYIIST